MQNLVPIALLNELIKNDSRGPRHPVALVQRYAPELERRVRKRLRATNDSWRVDETNVRVKGQRRYLCRAVVSSGATLDFLLSAKQDAEAAKRFLANALGRATPSSYTLSSIH